MLRSVVGALAANMMLVQCNSGVPISLACSTGSASVLTTASPEPRPWGTSRACNQADDRLELRVSGHIGRLNIDSEVGVIDPHPVQDHCDASGQSDHRPLGTTAAGELGAPCSQPRGSPANRRKNSPVYAQSVIIWSASGIPEQSWWLLTPSRGLGAARIFDVILHSCLGPIQGPAEQDKDHDAPTLSRRRRFQGSA
ncbi:hypothetical protein C8J30_110116 [Rhodobacter viridis]|uniref:Uncharacterized protein n=1 Tax=Rhodobacter viridis TaxID=1054202 RepID=A0A318TX17_9RHOB|nr:hypothetical protein C8J30_110116 [Rhodobacter viridis]